MQRPQYRECRLTNSHNTKTPDGYVASAILQQKKEKKKKTHQKLFFISLLPTIKGSLCTIKREIRAEVAKSAESIKHGCCFIDGKMKQIGKCLKSCILFEDGQIMIAVAAKKGTFLWAESLTMVIVNKKLSLFYKSWLYQVSNCKIKISG